MAAAVAVDSPEAAEVHPTIHPEASDITTTTATTPIFPMARHMEGGEGDRRPPPPVHTCIGSLWLVRQWEGQL